MNREQSTGLRPELLFVLACTWTVVSLAGGSLAAALAAVSGADAVRYGVTAALLATGFLLLARLGIADLRPLSSIGLVRRPGQQIEFGKGVALGWAIGLAMVLPALISGRSFLRIDLGPGAWVRLGTGTLVLVLFAAVVQLLLAGLPMRLLVRIAGPGWTLTAVVALAALLAALSGQSSLSDCCFVVLSVALFTVAFLRTRALWHALGLQAGWTVSQSLLFGSPLPHTPPVSGVVFLNSPLITPSFADGAFGPELPAYALFVLLLALLALLRLTRDYAWLYTYQSPVPGGYPMEVQPPPQHAAQAAAEASPQLIQIAPITSTPPPPASQDS